MIVDWSPEARSDLEAIEAYIAERNPVAADTIVAEILEAGASLHSFSRRGRPSHRRGARELVVTGRPYLIVYRIRGEAVTILRVMHTSRDWRPRRRRPRS
jgi:toxin ParE1/3/4